MQFMNTEIRGPYLVIFDNYVQTAHKSVTPTLTLKCIKTKLQMKFTHDTFVLVAKLKWSSVSETKQQMIVGKLPQN